MLMRLKKFGEAWHYYSLVTNQRNFKSLGYHHKEAWNIFYSYFFFLNQSGSKFKTEGIKRFKLGKFINESPVYSKDKKGSNTTILIIQILTLLLRKDYESVVSRINAINSYNYKYGLKKLSPRTYAFIKMLSTISGSNFNSVAIIRKSDRYLQILKEYPLESMKDASETEIVPYEYIWELVLDILDSRFYYASRKKKVKTHK
jgi:hypothetical protein